MRYLSQIGAKLSINTFQVLYLTYITIFPIFRAFLNSSHTLSSSLRVNRTHISFWQEGSNIYRYLRIRGVNKGYVKPP